jgi:signal transduction histidine kinase
MSGLAAPQRGLASGLARLGWRRALFDLGLALGITSFGVVNLYLLLGPLADISRKLGAPPTYSPALAIIGVLAMTLPLVLRRLYPASTLIVITAAIILITIERVPVWAPAIMAMLVGIYTGGAYASPRRALLTRLLTIVVTVTPAVYVIATSNSNHRGLDELDDKEQALYGWFSAGTKLVITVVAIIVAWALGDIVRRLRERETELTARTADLVRANRTIAEQAAADERLRIARELHDVVAHHVSVMGLQAGAARTVLERDPDTAVQALRTVEDTGRQAVAELQRMLGMLRSSARDYGQPQPTMADLVHLVERMRETGLDVRVRTMGARPPLPTGVELSIYRVVQEALTNALKHAGERARVDLELEYSQTQLQLAIRSRGAPGAAAPGAPGNDSDSSSIVGRGLIGMRERIGMHGGQLHTRTLDDGRFEVLATIPI